jgi:hypothetical protein
MAEKKTPDYKEEFKLHVEEAGRDLLRQYHDQLTPPQIELFNRMYGSIDEIPFEKMAWAYQQVRRTVDENKVKE